jgi:hypothetical protein
VTVAVDVVVPEALLAASVYVVVDVGLTLVEPFADMDVSVPGVIAMLVAPVVAQLSVLLEPELMPAGFAVNDVMLGAGPVVGLVEVGSGLLEPPQLISPVQASRMRATVQKPTPPQLRAELLARLTQKVGEPKRNSSVATIHSSRASAHTAGRNAGAAQCVANFLNHAWRSPFRDSCARVARLLRKRVSAARFAQEVSGTRDTPNGPTVSFLRTVIVVRAGHVAQGYAEAARLLRVPFSTPTGFS